MGHHEESLNIMGQYIWSWSVGNGGHYFSRDCKKFTNTACTNRGLWLGKFVIWYKLQMIFIKKHYFGVKLLLPAILSRNISPRLTPNMISPFFFIFTSLFHSMPHPTNRAFAISLVTPKYYFLINIIRSLYHLTNFPNHVPWVGHAVSVNFLQSLEK